MSLKGLRVDPDYEWNIGSHNQTITILDKSLNKTIKKVWLDKESNCLNFIFTDSFGMYLYDDGQDCCETRYMSTDDNLTEFCNAKLLDIELKHAPDQEDEYGDPIEIQFLDIKTDKGVFQVANYNNHNGYYSGFDLIARELN